MKSPSTTSSSPSTSIAMLSYFQGGIRRSSSSLSSPAIVIGGVETDDIDDPPFPARATGDAMASICDAEQSLELYRACRVRATATTTKITTIAATLQSNGAQNRRRDGDGDEGGDGMTMTTTMMVTTTTTTTVTWDLDSCGGETRTTSGMMMNAMAVHIRIRGVARRFHPRQVRYRLMIEYKNFISR